MNLLAGNAIKLFHEVSLLRIAEMQKEYTFGVDFGHIMGLSRTVISEDEAAEVATQNESGHDIPDDLEYVTAVKSSDSLFWCDNGCRRLRPVEVQAPDIGSTSRHPLLRKRLRHARLDAGGSSCCVLGVGGVAIH